MCNKCPTKRVRVEHIDVLTGEPYYTIKHKYCSCACAPNWQVTTLDNLKVCVECIHLVGVNKV